MPTNPDIQSILHLASQAYGTNENVLGNIAQDESSGNVGAVNHWDSNAKAGTPSAGLFQFIQPTFQSYAAKAKAANPSAWKGVNANWMDPTAQALTASWAIKNGHGSAWSTYSRALQQAHVTPGSVASGRVGLVTTGLPGITLPTPEQIPTTTAQVAAGPDPTADYFKNQPGQEWFGEFLDHVQQQKASTQVAKFGDPSAAGQSLIAGNGAIGQSAAAMQAALASGDPQKLVATATAETGKVAAQAAAFLKQNGIPYSAGEWCKEFVDSVFKSAGLHPPAGGVENVPGLLKWAEANHASSRAAAPGEEVMFDWNGDGTPDHVGLVTSVAGGKVQEVGGNQGGGAGAVTRDTFAANDPHILGYVRG